MANNKRTKQKKQKQSNKAAGQKGGSMNFDSGSPTPVKKRKK